MSREAITVPPIVVMAAATYRRQIARLIRKTASQ
jgi:hypothetical protein